MDLFTEKLAVFPVLRATTKAEVEEGKKKLTDGLKVGTPCGALTGGFAATRHFSGRSACVT